MSRGLLMSSMDDLSVLQNYKDNRCVINNPSVRLDLYDK